MILILSKNNETSTNLVIKWICFLDPSVKIVRLNSDDDDLKDIFISEENIILSTSGNKLVNLKEVSSIWYRRGFISKFVKFNDLSFIKNRQFKEALFDYLSIENNYLFKTIYNFYKRKTHINKISDSYISKVEMLKIAKEVGLKIPSYIITTRKSDLHNFIMIHKHVITKPIKTVFRSFSSMYSLRLFTTKIDINQLANLPNTFFPSFFQKLIKKKYEIRIVFLHKQFFSMALFSQLDEQTALDFRNYDIHKNGRWVPYKLDESIKIKLRKLMELLDLNSGSIDIIVDKNDDFYFLEVNPVGQFGMVSITCNYFLEKKIAKILINNERAKY